MKRIATITFHHAHNFGSVLQTYALQKYICRLIENNHSKVDYKIINFYTKSQEELYSIFKHDISIKSVVKNLIALRYLHKLRKKHRKFEDFINQRFNLTPRYFTESEISINPPVADYYISGSDQIWNVRAHDFSDVYYLNFVNEGTRISYAASFGPLGIDWNKYNEEKYRDYLRDYRAISTREFASADNVKQLIGVEPEINLDPTFLLTIDEWREIQSSVNFNNGKYILLYCLEPTVSQINLAKKLSTHFGLPILVLRYNNKNDWFNPFVKRYDSGPCDFLSYIDNASLVLSSSFHGTAFSIIYHKPFYVFNGLEDNRISSILKKTGLESRSINDSSDISMLDLNSPNSEMIDNFINKEREKTNLFLNNALDNSYND